MRITTRRGGTDPKTSNDVIYHYGIVVAGARAGWPAIIAWVTNDGEVVEWNLDTIKDVGWKVEKVPESEAPRREYRKIIRHMGAVPAEEMMGPASEEELDMRWELLKGLGAAS